MTTSELLEPEQVEASVPAGAWHAALARHAQDMNGEIPTWDENTSEAPLEWSRRMGISSELECRAASSYLNATFFSELSTPRPAARFTELFPISYVRRQVMLAVDDPDHGPLLVLGDPRSFSQLDVVRRRLGIDISLAFAPAEVVLRAIDVAYQQRTGQAENLIESLDKGDVLRELAELTDREDLLDTSGRAPVIKLVNLMLFEAVKSGASDIHIQPYENRVVVRMRIDGLLFDMFTLPKHLQEEVTSRVKVQGKMNIAEKRLPQDGRASVQVGNRSIDLRIASLPASHGERVVIRLLDKSARLYTLPEVGMDEHSLVRYRQFIHLEHGLILVTGPTGSGKSTTLYAALQEINSKDRNIVTLEDPIEYEIDGVSQTQINVKKGMTFATGLRNVLRQDPDIIMVGEIRDHETAVMAIQSALTGHLVFSTLHTNDAASAVTRLLDLGIEPYLVSSSLLAVLAQRLVRRVCGECATSRPPAKEELAALGISEATESAKVTCGSGCPKCRSTGYKGRVGIFELLTVDDAVRDAIQNRANAAEIRDVAVEHAGMRLLRDDGIQKILKGQTTVEEVERVTMRTNL